MKPHVVLITPDFPPDVGGIQAVLYNAALAFTRFDVTVIAPAHPDASTFDHSQPFRILRIRPADAPTRFGRIVRTGLMAVETMKLVRRHSRVIVLCGHPFTAVVGLLAKRTTGVPYIVWTHAKELLVWQWMLRRSLPAADAVLVISEYTSGLVERLGVPREKLVPIPYAPDSPVESLRDDAANTTRGKRPPVILTVARLDELYKGHDVMMRVLPLVSSKFPGLEWVIVGDGKLRRHYERLAASNGVTDRVRFVGAVSRLERDRWLRECDLFVMLSRDRALDGGAEGFGIVFLEAGAFGKPVVAGRAGGAIDAVVDGVTGMLVDPENEIEIAEAICRILGNESLARKLGQNGHARVRDELSWSRTATVIEDTLSAALTASS